MRAIIDKMDNFGRGITYYDNKICFIDNAFIGDEVLYEVVADKKKYYLGKVLEYVNKSRYRIDSKCPFSDKCGGCSFQNMDFSYENQYKLNRVREILKKFGDVSDSKILDIVYDREDSYRNKIVLHGTKSGLGYYEANSKNIVSIDKCLIADDKINDIVMALENVKFGNASITIRTSNDGSMKMISITGDVSNYDVLFNYCDSLIINNKTVFGRDKIISNIGNKKYYVSSKSFFQVNKNVTKLLYEEVKKIVKETRPNNVLDLYCGTGTIGIYVSDSCSKVVGVEEVREAICDALENKNLNKCNNIEFICEKVENVIDRFSDFDFIIVDPPRAGLDKKTIDNILRIRPNTIVYVSCDTVTLARDIKYLSCQYDVLYDKVFNMFPRSYHTENVCVLSLK